MENIPITESIIVQKGPDIHSFLQAIEEQVLELKSSEVGFSFIETFLSQRRKDAFDRFQKYFPKEQQDFHTNLSLFVQNRPLSPSIHLSIKINNALPAHTNPRPPAIYQT